MDPVTAIAAASTAYQAIRKGFAIGKEVQSMSKDIGDLMNAINSVKEGHEKAKTRRFGSVEEEALQTYAAKKKAEKMEAELRNFLIGNYGPDAWQAVLRIQADIRKQRLLEKQQRARRIETLIEWTLIGVSVLLCSFIGIFIIINVGVG